MKQQMYFDERFLDQYTGRKLLHDPITAIVELVANSWDAGATRVDIAWPDAEGGYIKISDNGEGMSVDEFRRRWLTFSYNRIDEQGDAVSIVGHKDLPLRKTFGRNGVGRFAGFCFAKEYVVVTQKNDKQVSFLVGRGEGAFPITLKEIDSPESVKTASGTVIRIENTLAATFSAEKIRSEIGMRFLIDPNFQVFVNKSKVAFSDLPSDGVSEYWVELPDYNAKIKIVLIDAKKADRTTKQHGIAWQVNSRLVGECGWQGSGQESFLDGRRIEAKRYTFIIFADVLNHSDCIKPDWSGFQEDDEKYKAVFKAVQEKIREILLSLTEGRRAQITETIRQANANKIRLMSPLSRARWDAFVQNVQEQCPGVAERDLEAVAGVMAKLEMATSRFGLIHQLHDLRPEQLDDLHKILSEWNVDAAKIVLDELRWRIKLIDELQRKVSSTSTLEVQELQPLFEKGLWIFGPEFETIEFSSNQSMVTLARKLFKKEIDASKDRPDFVVVPDGSCGFYSYPEYDNSFAEIGVAKLIIIELKKPGVSIGADQKNQCWDYVKELYKHNLLTERSQVRAFVLGSKIDVGEGEARLEKMQKVEIQPMLFDTVLNRAKSRVLKLFDKVKSAPFLKDVSVDDFLNDQASEELFSDEQLASTASGLVE